MFKFFKTLAFMALIFTFACSDENKAAQQEENNLSVVQISAPDNTERHTFKVEVADTNEEMYHGLMGRSSLDTDGGMLFDINLVPKDMDIAFWMKDTLIPLDIMFVDENGVIFHIHKNAVPFDTSPIYSPKRPRAVLEINGGQIEKYGISVGDILKNEMFNNKIPTK